ncbi:S41 family peptidase [Streptomyces sp. NPDC020192]|uniref:S41 family peptidase n=1 Tax=Streptomyces sp. NPDC020192 TaxID=3365066 RepID=UPI0037B2EFA5
MISGTRRERAAHRRTGGTRPGVEHRAHPGADRAAQGLVIALRVNGGGSDSLDIRIAQRLTDTPYVAYADPTRHTRPEPVPVVPADAPRYSGPVAVLTGGSGVSAGLPNEEFAKHRDWAFDTAVNLLGGHD